VPAYDVHQHLWPEPFISALSRRTEAPRLRGRTIEVPSEPACDVDLRAHALDERLRLLDRDGIDIAIISLAPTLDVENHVDLREAYHDGILEVASASGGRILPLAAGEQRDGFVGACVSAPALVAGVEPLLDDLAGTGQLLFVHPGPPPPAPPGAPAWWPAVVDYTMQMQRAFLTWLARDAESHRAVPVVFAMLGGGAPIQLERLRSRGVEPGLATLPNVYLEISSYGRCALELCLAAIGTHQLLYGSDAPVIDPGQTLAELRALGDPVIGEVLAENPSRLLGGRS
jgi:predicted TIM-barrel fold metal-dependent hydrolase